MSTYQERIQAALESIETLSAQLQTIVAGDKDASVAVEGRTIQSIANFYASITSQYAADDVLASSIEARDAAIAAQQAAQAAETNVTTSVRVVGELSWFYRAAIPSGWLICDGRAVSRATYAALFSALGGLAGDGDGETTFDLPNLLDRFIRSSTAAGEQGGSDSARPDITVAGTTLTTAQLPAHSHKLGLISGTSSGSSSHVAFGNGGAVAHDIHTEAVGGSQPHSHSASASDVDNRPAFTTAILCIYAGV